MTDATGHGVSAPRPPEKRISGARPSVNSRFESIVRRMAKRFGEQSALTPAPSTDDDVASARRVGDGQRREQEIDEQRPVHELLEPEHQRDPDGDAALE